MDSLFHATPEKSLPRFVLRWLLSWILPAILATCLVGTLGNLRLGGASLVLSPSALSFKAQSALL
jgi:hypothetical protein